VQTDSPAAWIIARPVGDEMARAIGLFGRLVALAATGRAVSPHLTIELVYAPLPNVERLAESVRDIAAVTDPFAVPAVGVYVQSGVLSIHLARVEPLLELRRELAGAVAALEGDPYPFEDWRPHLSVAPAEPPDQFGLGTLGKAIAGYAFEVQCLVLSLATGQPDRFVEIGPFPLRPSRRGTAPQRCRASGT
jgi:hypothetical protein